MEKQGVKNRYYKISINIGPFCYFQNSKVYEIPEGQSTILPGVIYSFVTILLGWWGFRLRRPFESFSNSFEALHVNFSGGEDVTTKVNELQYDEKTNYVWKNILRKTSERLTMDEVEMINEIQEEYMNLSEVLYADDNVNFVILNLNKADIHRINRDDILDIFDALKTYELN